MKTRLLSFVALLLALALVAAACGDDESEDTTTTTAAPTVLDLALQQGQFSTLVAAIEAAGLSETLQGEGPFTVFAPTDAAFDEAFEALGITGPELLADTTLLTAILTYHVLPQEADSQLVATLDGQDVLTLNGQSVRITVEDGGSIKVNEASVVSADLEADNGIVHVINGVLLPPDIAATLGVAMDDEMTDETTTTTAAPETTTTTAAPETTTTEAPEELPTIAQIVADAAAGDPAEFTVLLAALETAGLVDALNNPDDELTVFAPTDEAFGNLLAALDITAEELLAREDLADILLYHVAPGVFPAADVVAAAPIDALPTLNPAGATLKVEVIDNNVVINEGAEPLGGSTVIQPDVFASNGVIHVIDVVLLPAS